LEAATTCITICTKKKKAADLSIGRLSLD